MSEEREHYRRQDDKTVIGFIARLSKIVQHYKALSVGFVALVGTVSSAAAFIGAQRGMPARVARVERKVDSGFKAMQVQVDTLVSQATALKLNRDGLEERLDLLLRLNCPSVKQPELVRPCRPYLAR